jgi:hypothetical protein
MRPLLKLTFLLILVFAVCIGLIRAQPYDDSELRAFLTPPDGCPMPCFMGIRPGVTTADEALAILETHEWVGEIYTFNNGMTGELDYMNWDWTGKQSNLIQAATDTYPNIGSLRITDGTVTDINVPTLISLGDIWLLWESQMNFFTLVRGLDEDDPTTLIYYNRFSSHHASIAISTACPYFPTFWNSAVAITLGDLTHDEFTSEHYTSIYNPFFDFVFRLRNNFC